MRIVDLEQRSGAWLEWRRTGIGSSDAPTIWYGRHFGKSVQDLWLQKVGDVARPEKTGGSENGAMRRGRQLEPHILGIYHEIVGVESTPLCAVHQEEKYGWCKASFDGYLWDADIVVEAKAPNYEDHCKALEGVVTEKYVPQLDHQLLVSGSERAHYISYSTNKRLDPEDRFAIVPYFRDDKRVHSLLQKEEQFWDCVVNRTPPR